MSAKILINASTFPRWVDDHIPIFVWEFSKALFQKGFQVHVLTPHYKGSKFIEVMSGVTVYRFPYFLYGLENFSNGKAIIETLKRNKLNYLLIPFYFFSNLLAFVLLNSIHHYQFVNIHWVIPSGLIGVLFKPLFKYKLLITSHGGDIFDFQKLYLWKLIKPFMRFILKQTDTLLVVSAAIKEAVQKIWGKKIARKAIILSMGIDFRKFNQARNTIGVYSDQAFHILFVGRLVRRKGADILINACQLLTENKLNYHCTIIGDGPEFSNLKQMVVDYRLNQQIEFTGFIQHGDILKYLAGSGCLVGPARSEGLGLVFLEAMAAGTPVIAANVDGIADIVKDHETGLLIGPDDPDALKQAVLTLQSDKQLRQNLIDNGLKLARSYDWDQIALRFSDIGFERTVDTPN